jgi:hypothetical protein
VALTKLEQDFLRASRIAKRALEYEGDDRTAFRGAGIEALNKVVAAAEKLAGNNQRTGDA